VEYNSQVIFECAETHAVLELVRFFNHYLWNQQLVLLSPNKTFVMNKNNQNDQQNKDWSKQQKQSNEGMPGSTNQGQQTGGQWNQGSSQQGNQGNQGRSQQGNMGNQGQQGQGSQGQQNQGGRQKNEEQDPVEERSPKASGNRQQDSKSGENRDPEINMPSNEPEKTEKKIPNYE
jgi:hypothetical protein